MVMPLESSLLVQRSPRLDPDHPLFECVIPFILFDLCSFGWENKSAMYILDVILCAQKINIVRFKKKQTVYF